MTSSPAYVAPLSVVREGNPTCTIAAVQLLRYTDDALVKHVCILKILIKMVFVQRYD